MTLSLQLRPYVKSQLTLSRLQASFTFAPNLDNVATTPEATFTREGSKLWVISFCFYRRRRCCVCVCALTKLAKFTLAEQRR